MERTYIQDVPHIPQVSDWDCGIACLKMALKIFRCPHYENVSEDELEIAMKLHGVIGNVWTIDLAYLCAKLNIKHSMYTITMGTNKGYHESDFYVNNMKSGSTLSDEEIRVNKLFDEASEKSVPVQQKSVPLEDIIAHLKAKQVLKETVAIVLIDDHKLRRGTSNYDGTNSNCCSPGNYFSWSTGDEGYWGHFILVVGCDIQNRKIIFNDPCPKGYQLACDFDVFDEARKSFGTDEDILLLFKS